MRTLVTPLSLAMALIGNLVRPLHVPSVDMAVPAVKRRRLWGRSIRAGKGGQRRYIDGERLSHALRMRFPSEQAATRRALGLDRWLAKTALGAAE